MADPDRKAVTAGRLRELLHYDPETGGFTRRVGGRGLRRGAAAGSVMADGYLSVRIDGRRYQAHRLAWLYMTGELPAAQIDHRDGDRANNKIANLREATAAENNQNCGRTKRNTSGFVGAHWHRGSRRWHAKISVAGRKLYLGSFDAAEEAHAAYLDAKFRLHSFQPVPRISCEAPASDRREGL